MSVRSAWGLAALVALAALLLLAVSCGGDDDDSGDGGATSPAAESATPGSGPGTITLTSSAIEGQNGKILLVFAIGSTGGDRVARLCQSITSDDYEMPGSVMTEVPAGNDPCGGDSSDATLEEGTYQLTAGIYVGGQQTPEKMTTLNVEVAGDVTAELDGAELSN